MITTTALDYYHSIGAHLFPIRPGDKNPTGIVNSFVKECSPDLAQWQAWAAAHLPDQINFGLVAGPSHLIVVDIDVKKVTQKDVWEKWQKVWNNQLKQSGPAPDPHVQTQSGGWHIYFSTKQIEGLRQPKLSDYIDVRAGNGYVVTAGSVFEGRSYQLFPKAPKPYPAPAELIEHCKGSGASKTSIHKPGTYQREDVAALLKWLTEAGHFEHYDDWVSVGMALKVEFGDDPGFDLWTLTHDETVMPGVAEAKWKSFDYDVTSTSVTLRTWMDRAHKAGWTGGVKTSAAAIFADAAGGTVGTIAKLAGATLSLTDGQEILIGVCDPILKRFLEATSAFPNIPLVTNHPDLPEAMKNVELARDAIKRIVAIAEMSTSFKSSRVVDALAAIHCLHDETGKAVCQYLRMLGKGVSDALINPIIRRITHQNRQAQNTKGTYITNSKGEPIGDNYDNFPVFMKEIDAELRWNAWLERPEIKGHEWPEWTFVDDAVFRALKMRASQTDTAYRPTDSFLFAAIDMTARQFTFDPVCNLLDTFAAKWDGTKRLDTWLPHMVGAPLDDHYLSCVGRLLIGSMVRRIREPGCKQDEMIIFLGRQGTYKSTLARLLALNDAWFTDDVLLGEASKELVLLLAGKTVVEVSEMGSRSSADINKIKAMVSRQVDAGRPAYGRSVMERPRRNIFIGTTNDETPLVDEENRRFLPVRVDNPLPFDWLQSNIAQIVGEAAAAHAKGESFALPMELWDIAAEKQREARSESPMEIRFDDWFAPTQFSRDAYITAGDLQELIRIGGLRGKPSPTLTRLGFKSARASVDGKQIRVWRRGLGTMAYMVTKDQTTGSPVVRVVPGRCSAG